MTCSMFIITVLLAVVAVATGSHVIIVSKGHSCLPSNTVCAPGLVCAGTSKHKICVTPMPAGGRCNADPFWVCQSGLVCEDHICRIPKNGNCISSPTYCASGLVCAGTSKRKKCVTPMGEGQRCKGDPFWVCRNGLVCEDNICKTPRNGSCLSRRAVCVDGTTCAGTSSDKRCVTPMGEGGRCNADPFWICQSTLVCVNHVCRAPLGSGERCDTGNGVCESGLSCEGTKREKRCVKLRKEGKSCGVIGFIRCAAGLACLHNKCVPAVIPKGRSCENTSNACVEGTVCAGPKGKMRCVKAMGRGERCDIEPFWKCSLDLQCVHYRCVDY